MNDSRAILVLMSRSHSVHTTEAPLFGPPRMFHRSKCAVFVTVQLSLTCDTMGRRLSALMSLTYNNGGAQMHETTAVVLLVVVLGQTLIFTIAGIAMWIAGEFGEPPRWWRWSKRGRAGETTGSGMGTRSENEDLASLHHEIPIAPTSDVGFQMSDIGGTTKV